MKTNAYPHIFANHTRSAPGGTVRRITHKPAGSIETADDRGDGQPVDEPVERLLRLIFKGGAERLWMARMTIEA